MKKILLIAYCFLIISCSSTRKDDLKSNVTIREVFNDQEIKDLTVILNFFEEQIASQIRNEAPDKLDYFENYLAQLTSAAKSGELILKIPYIKQEEMYNQISDSTFKQIWTFGKYWKYQSTDTLKYLVYNQNGKYIRFLSKLGENDPIVQSYYQTFIDFGDLAPTMIANILMRYKELNLSDVRIRLMIAIHYLTINDQFERKEKY
ncbi:hypothetical protein ACE01N_19985 [Saccharicrinis sp. FJH2]|uniref:hypothetical protein n=1 Tax=Saccharicrinis sp. FJH65 TaxID=3344659 RepID=UPI0035F4DA4E